MHLAQQVLVQVVQVDQLEIAANVQADLVDLVQVAQGLADLPALAQGHREQLARQVVVQVVVRIHQVVAAMQRALSVNPVADLQRVASQSVQSVKSTTT